MSNVDIKLILEKLGEALYIHKAEAAKALNAVDAVTYFTSSGLLK